MAIYRTIQLTFWTDNKVVDDFTPEDKYFYLYLFTNPQTNLCGCYEVSLTTMANQTGYNKETIIRLIDRFENIHKVIKYSSKTKEILLLNWHKYNWTSSPNFVKGLKEQIAYIKMPDFKAYLTALINDDGTVYRPSIDGMGTSVTVTVSDTVTVTDTDYVKEVIDYLNSKLGTKYTYKSKAINSKIKARLGEGHTVDDFKKVIDIKYDEWHDDPKMSVYLRPDTLFATKFDSYLNQKPKTKAQKTPKSGTKFNDFEQTHNYDMTDLEKMLLS